MANLNIRMGEVAEDALDNLVKHTHLSKTDIVKQLIIHANFRLKEGEEYNTLSEEEKTVDWLRGYYQGKDSAITTLLSSIGIFR